MVRMIMHGCGGAMGRVITELAKGQDSIIIAAGVDKEGGAGQDYPVYRALEDVKEEADVIVDFSAASAVDHLLDYCEERRMPVVLCTTGLSGEQAEHVLRASKGTALLRSANMSLGVNLLLKMVGAAAQTLAAAGFDVEIVEKHHNQKLDAPSGTALALADSVNEAMGHPYHYVYDRSQKHEKRDGREIGISAVRGGSIVGDHDVIFAGKDEVVTFSHAAYSKAIFAKGAIEAAKFLAGKPAGLYSMADVIEGR